MLGDPELSKLKKGDIIQLQRRGFFKVDEAYQGADMNTCKEHPIILFYIPDGHTKENPTAGVPKNTTANQTNAKVSSQPFYIEFLTILLKSCTCDESSGIHKIEVKN